MSILKLRFYDKIKKFENDNYKPNTDKLNHFIEIKEEDLVFNRDINEAINYSFDFEIDLKTDVIDSYKTKEGNFVQCSIIIGNKTKPKKKVMEDYYLEQIKISKNKKDYFIVPWDELDLTDESPYLVHLSASGIEEYHRTMSKKELFAFIELINEDKLVCIKSIIEELNFKCV